MVKNRMKELNRMSIAKDEMRSKTADFISTDDMNAKLNDTKASDDPKIRTSMLTTIVESSSPSFPR